MRAQPVVVLPQQQYLQRVAYSRHHADRMLRHPSPVCHFAGKVAFSINLPIKRAELSNMLILCKEFKAN